jgi:iron(III) transport system permease protein
VSPVRRSATAVVALAILLLIALPLAELIAAAAAEGPDVLQATWQREVTRRALRNSLGVGLVVTFVGTAVAVAAALLTERARVPARTAVRVAVLVPLLIPGFVSALSFERAYGPGGLTDRLLGWSAGWLYGPVGVIVVIAVNAVPLAYLVVVASLATRGEPELEQAARVAGASAWTAFRTVTLPLLAPAIVAAGAIQYVVAVNNFGVPAVLGVPARFPTATTELHRSLVRSAAPDAFATALTLALLLVAITVVVVVVGERWLARRPVVSRTEGPSGAPPGGPPSRLGRIGAALAFVALTLTVVLPTIALLLTSLVPAPGIAPVPSNWTIDNLTGTLSGSGWAPLVRSLTLATVAATLLLPLGATLAALRRRRPSAGWNTAVTLAFAVPGSALAVAVALTYGRWLADTLLLILLAYLAKLWALGHRPVAGALDRLPDGLIDAARANGAGGATALRTVAIPVLLPVLAGAWLLVWVFAFQEVTMSSLLYGPGSETLAVVILNLRQLGDVGGSAALGVILTVVSLPVAVGAALARRTRAVQVGGR